jgi:hypothetical protein
VRAVNQLAGQDPRATPIPYDCEAVRLFNRVRSRWMVPSVPVPGTRYIGGKFNLEFGSLEAEFGLPFVVKPTNRSGCGGVEVVCSRRDFESRILRNPGYRFESLIAPTSTSTCCPSTAGSALFRFTGPAAPGSNSFPIPSWKKLPGRSARAAVTTA